MGYDNEYITDDMLHGRDMLYIDTETAALENAAAFCGPVQPDKRLTDPVKIKADIAAKEAARAFGLDWNTGRFVAVGWQKNDEEPRILVCMDRADEMVALTAFADAYSRAKHPLVVGYKCRTFDLPYMMRRAFYLDLAFPRFNLAKYRRDPVFDLYDYLTFDGIRYGNDRASVMSERMVDYCKRCELDIPDDDEKGSEIQKLVDAGDWAGIEQHLRRDIQRTVALARRVMRSGVAA